MTLVGRVKLRCAVYCWVPRHATWRAAKVLSALTEEISFGRRVIVLSSRCGSLGSRSARLCR